MKRLLWQNAFFFVVFLIFATSISVAFYYFLPRPLFPNSQGDITAQIEKINDIEHLRKIALLQARNDVAKNRTFNELTYQSVHTMVSLAVLGAIFSFINFVSVVKLKKKESGPNPSWMKWF